MGKTTVVDQIKNGPQGHRYHVALTATTRPPREAEVDGVDYYFRDTRQFSRMLAQKELMENATVYGHQYGVPKGPVRDALGAEKDVLLRTDIQGARYIKMKWPQIVTIFLTSPSAEELSRRLESRGTEDAREITARLEMASTEIATAREFDYQVINDDVLRAAAEVEQIIAAERSRSREPLEL